MTPGPGIEPRATLVGGERFHHGAIPALLPACVYFVICRKQGPKMEAGVLNRVGLSGMR